MWHCMVDYVYISLAIIIWCQNGVTLSEASTRAERYFSGGGAVDWEKTDNDGQDKEIGSFK